MNNLFFMFYNMFVHFKHCAKVLFFKFPSINILKKHKFNQGEKNKLLKMCT